ncbi:hypothetical protein M405DRAFT_814428 [Rhizopogon salebrosus TDB-379]|nr:hypothetical protein M405DRAFT_814428 [Rhizopogon salebrosus TDB-379]
MCALHLSCTFSALPCLPCAVMHLCASSTASIFAPHRPVALTMLSDISAPVSYSMIDVENPAMFAFPMTSSAYCQ